MATSQFQIHTACAIFLSSAVNAHGLVYFSLLGHGASYEQEPWSNHPGLSCPLKHERCPGVSWNICRLHVCRFPPGRSTYREDALGSSGCPWIFRMRWRQSQSSAVSLNPLMGLGLMPQDFHLPPDGREGRGKRNYTQISVCAKEDTAERSNFPKLSDPVDS